MPRVHKAKASRKHYSSQKYDLLHVEEQPLHLQDDEIPPPQFRFQDEARLINLGQRVLGPLGTVIGDTSPNQNSNSKYGNPTFYCKGTWDPKGPRVETLASPHGS